VPSAEPNAPWAADLRASGRTLGDLERHLRLTDDERRGIARAARQGLPLAITPYYLSLCDPIDPRCPIRMQCVPSAREQEPAPGDRVDPLGEVAHEVAPHLIQRYPDRALLLVTDRCSVYCRFCTRSRMVGGGEGAIAVDALGPAMAYLARTPAIRDVILSGGDPLMLATPKIEAILARLRRIPHVEVLRVATRAPVVLPSRIDGELCAALRRAAPLYVMTHFNHPKELTERSAAACAALVDAGIVVLNQTVLLRGINSCACILEELFRGLLRMRVKPYYLLQCDPTRGNGHFRTPLGTGIEIMDRLRGRVSGIALPTFIVDTPGGHGKVALGPDYVLGRDYRQTTLRAPDGEVVEFAEPAEANRDCRAATCRCGESP
jgi:lysine 2,3-aminomutase